MLSQVDTVKFVLKTRKQDKTIKNFTQHHCGTTCGLVGHLY